MTAEQALVFEVAGTAVVGVLSAPEAAPAGAELGVVVVVGGPQYRVGSHRQFVQLARCLAAAGFPVLRFDVRGMGDGGGDQRSFEALGDDIAAAIDAMQQQRPSVRQVVLWGLCDGASAALLYLDEHRDARVCGMCLANPWVRSAASQARANVKHYYRERLLQKDFWLKLLRGGVAGQALKSLWQNMRLARAGQAGAGAASGQALAFQVRMARGWQKAGLPVLLLQSGADYTAREFDEFVAMDRGWQRLVATTSVTRVDLAAADHTLSDAASRQQAEQATVDWLRHLLRHMPMSAPSS